MLVGFDVSTTKPIDRLLWIAYEEQRAGPKLGLLPRSPVLRYRGDPDEAMAWAIRGSTFYLMGKNGKAKAAWKRAYAIDAPFQSNQFSGYAIELHGTAKLLGDDTASVTYDPYGSQNSVSQ